ncbi:MAG: acyltransferase family protein [Oceanicaulis sp.]|nr:acyltransferase family protein [Oceanicaulis sp.]
MTPPDRRPDLDALRVFAFAVLIFYHTGMGYVTWDWHVKSVYAGPVLESLMALSSPWRLPLLFFISGVAMAMLHGKLGAAGFARDRAVRLLAPLILAMAVIVVPQAYGELRQSGEIEAGYWAFWARYLSFQGGFSIITPTWNHMWFVAYLAVYALALAPVIALLSRAGARSLDARLTGWRGAIWLLIAPIAPLLLIRFTLAEFFPVTHDLVNDWATHAFSLTFVLYGVAIARSGAAWRAVDRIGPAAGALCLAAGAVLVVVWQNWDVIAAQPLQAAGWRALRLAYAWWVILALLWLARRLVRRSGPVLQRMSALIFPVYLIHQTITVMAIYWITAAGWRFGAVAEFTLVAGATLLGSIGFALAAERTGPLRVWFGLKPRLSGGGLGGARG